MQFLILFFAVAVLLYFRVNLKVSTGIIVFVLMISSVFSGSGALPQFLSWVIFIAVAIPLNILQLRQEWISSRVLALFKKLMPAISQTEREALEAGSIWWEGDLFGGKPDWSKLHSYKNLSLSKEEQDFLDGPTEELCKMLDDFEITSKLKDLPQKTWDFIKKKRFFGMIIPKEYGGLEFSAYGHSQVIMKIASRSTTAAVTIMVPNSLGPAELIMAYGTDDQKKHYLPRLADGTEVPCFALTSPHAGSDAGSMPDTGYVEKGKFKGKEVIGLRLNFDKRYITLSSNATVIGLAFRLFDPNHLIGDKEDVGITVALVPSDIPGVKTGPRHDPTGTPFINGPVRGENVFIPVDYIVGGTKEAGHGWKMLMERLAIGRSISLPALSVAAAKLACRGTGAYARIRKQFKLPIGKFEGVEEALTRIAGNAYLMEAGRRMTLSAVDSGERPAIVSAISKYNLTERMREVVNHAMDVQGGGAIVMGPRNFMGTVYQGAPVSITVEGANILTRTLIVFGQGIIRAHPFVFKEMEAAFNPNPQKSLEEFDDALFQHIGFTSSNAIKSLFSALTFGIFISSPDDTRFGKYYKRLGWMSAAFAFMADTAILVLGGDLKRKEKISGRFADVLSQLYLTSAVLKRFEDDGKPAEDISLVQWSCEETLFKAQNQLDEIINNFPIPTISVLLRLIIFPLGKHFKAPDDRLGHKVASVLFGPSSARDRLTEGIFIPKDIKEPLGRIEDALVKVIKSEPLEKKIGKAVREGEIKSFLYEDQISEALKVKLITKDEKEVLIAGHRARTEVITVDEFPVDYWSGKKPRAKKVIKKKSLS